MDAIGRVLALAAVAQIVAAAALLIDPTLVGKWLFGTEFKGNAVVVARVAGIALFALAIACWPGPPLVGMIVYSALMTLYLAYVGYTVGLAGALLWPAVLLHVIMTALLVWASTSGRHPRA